MALVRKPVKVSTKVEKRLAQKLGVDFADFKRVKFVHQNLFRFSFFIFNKGDFVGTVNYFWDIRKPNQIIYLKRFSDDKVLRVKFLNDNKIVGFFDEI